MQRCRLRYLEYVQLAAFPGENRVKYAGFYAERGERLASASGTGSCSSTAAIMPRIGWADRKFVEFQYDIHIAYTIVYLGAMIHVIFRPIATGRTRAMS